MLLPLTARMWLLTLFAAIGARAADVAIDAETRAAVTRGQTLFVVNCSMCHHVTGIGAKGVYPPLAGSDWLKAHRPDAIRAVVSGLKDEIVVNGDTYRGQMPTIMLNDADVADTLTYVLNSW